MTYEPARWRQCSVVSRRATGFGWHSYVCMIPCSPVVEKDDGLGVAGATGFIVGVGVVVVAAGLGLAALRFAGGTPAEQGLEGAIGALALGAVVAAPGVLAILAVRDRTVLLLPAAIILIPLS